MRRTASVIVNLLACAICLCLAAEALLYCAPAPRPRPRPAQTPQIHGTYRWGGWDITLAQGGGYLAASQNRVSYFVGRWQKIGEYVEVIERLAPHGEEMRYILRVEGRELYTAGGVTSE